MNYRQALETLEEESLLGMHLGLERIRALLSFLGDPQEKLSIVHVGGTNGKGSTLAMIGAVLKEAGYRVGAFTSPHLLSYTECLTINGQPISEQHFVQLLEKIIPHFDVVKEKTGTQPSQFETLTAMAFSYFVQERVDLVLLEVGMGGAEDATNVVQAPELSIITNVTLDHAQYLGDTPAEIARVKSGIIKAGKPVITASSDPLVLQVIAEKAASLNAPLYRVSEHLKWQSQKALEAGQWCAFRSLRHDYGQLFVSLSGEHQVLNAATAILALELLEERGWNINPHHIQEGLQAVCWPARLQVIHKNPLVVLDGAHNPGAMSYLARWMARKRGVYKRIILVIGMLEDKDQKASVAYIQPYVDEVIVTKPASDRAGDWRKLGQCFTDLGQGVSYQEDVVKALHQVLQRANKQDLIIVTGSLYLAGKVLKAFPSA